MVNIFNIPEQYFFVGDTERQEAIQDSLETLASLKLRDTEEYREVLREQIKLVSGFRKAERLAYERISTLEELLLESKKRQQYLQRHLGERFHEAARKAAMNYPTNFGEMEVKRDAVFYTLARSGVMAIAESAGYKLDWEDVSRDILGGNRLEHHLNQRFIEDVVQFLPYAIMFNKHRDELKARLQSYGIEIPDIDKILPKPIDLAALNLREEQKQYAEELLEKCLAHEEKFLQQFEQITERLKLNEEKSKNLEQRLKKVVKGSTFRLANGLSQLQYGRVDDGVLSPKYLRSLIYSWFPLAVEFTKLGLKENNVEHVHTGNARYASMIDGNYLHTIRGLATKVINYINIYDVSRWCPGGGGFSILDPILKPESKTLGLFIGYLLFGPGGEFGEIGETRHIYHYFPINKDRKWFLDLLERIGVMSRDIYIGKTPVKEIANRLDRKTDSKRIAESYIVPKQFYSLALYALENSRKQEDIELAKAALFGLLDDRSSKAQKGKGVYAGLKLEYEEDIRRMAQLVGLKMSEGFTDFNKKRVYVSNPEVVGYQP